MSPAPRPPTYFAYGSNLHPLRLGRRTPSCRLLGEAVLPGYALRFHMRGGDGSAKADARYTGDSGDTVRGAVFALAPRDLPVLDDYEGLGGYQVRVAEVTLQGRRREVFLYTARPSHIDPALAPFTWYRDLVWHGAIWHGMPGEYVARIRAVDAVVDPDPERTTEHVDLLERMPHWRPEHGYR